MYVPYTEIPGSSRVWIYQSDKELTENQLIDLETKSIAFINQWTRHGDDLKGSFTVMYNHFLIFAVDEKFASVSGCSIDASVRFVRELEVSFEVDFMNKMNVAFKEREHLNIVSMATFASLAKEQKVTEDTTVFNNLVTTKEAIGNQWEIPAKASWHKRYFK